MPKASEIKKNAAVEYNGKIYLVKDINKLTPSGRAGASLYRMRLYEVATGAKADESFKADETKGLQVLLVEGGPVGIELPAAVDLVIEETDPSIKGASASARTKPAKLTTGLVIQVPEYISSGEKVRVNTEEGKFISRAD